MSVLRWERRGQRELQRVRDLHAPIQRLVHSDPDITDNAGGAAGTTQTVALTGSTTVTNTVPVTVSFGPNGQSGGYYDGIFTTVTVCEPGTTTCVPVPNVLVDTGSVGLRVLSSALAGVTLSQINDGSGDYLNECTEYGDGSFNWGPVSLATVQIGGETASQVPAAAGGTANMGIPIQVISSGNVPTNVTGSGQCASSTSTPDDDTVAALGANGILGVGNFAQDCGESTARTQPASRNHRSLLALHFGRSLRTRNHSLPVSGLESRRSIFFVGYEWRAAHATVHTCERGKPRPPAP